MQHEFRCVKSSWRKLDNMEVEPNNAHIPCMDNVFWNVARAFILGLKNKKINTSHVRSYILGRAVYDRCTHLIVYMLLKGLHDSFQIPAVRTLAIGNPSIRPQIEGLPHPERENMHVDIII